MKYSIKHIINRSLKPIVDKKDPEINLFPVYNQLIFKRKNYQFKSFVKSYYADLEHLTTDDSKLMTYEIELLSSIIEFEIRIKGEKYDVTGFGDRYEKYRRSVVAEAERLLIGKLEKILRKSKSKYQDIFNYSFIPGKVGLLLEVIGSLIPDMKGKSEFRECELAEIFWMEYTRAFPVKKEFGLLFPLVYNWIEGNHKQVMENIIKYKGIDDIEILLKYLAEFDFTMKSQIGMG